MTLDTVPSVHLAHGGGLRGRHDRGVTVFRGVPYAQAPQGALRFAAPEPVAAWTGLRDATAFAPVSPQWPRGGGAHARMLGGADCLAVNVWTPEPRAGANLPVMVWIPGGGFLRGGASDPLYDGASFAHKGIVVVSLQYRLGVDGFMHFGGDAPANRGLLDILAALRWVQAHIGAFGGDADRVTVFGESAGAGAIACLMGLEAAKGLFHRAILQSPSVACQTVAEADVVRVAVGQLLGVPPTLQGLGDAPLADVLFAVHRLAEDEALRDRHGFSRRTLFPLRPVIDGQMLAQAPLAALHRRWAVPQPPPLQVLVGSNAEEMRLYHVPNGAIDRITQDDVAAFMRDTGLPPAAREAYAALPATQGGAHAGEMLCAMQSDYYYRVPARRIAALAAAHRLPAHLYELEWRSPQCNGQLGAAHGMDLPFVFDNLDTSTGRELTGKTPPQPVADAMHSAWADFARLGDPGWPEYGPTPWMQFFNDLGWCGPAPASAAMRTWDGLL